MNLYDILFDLPNNISLSVGHAREGTNIVVSPLRNGEPVENIPILCEITPEGEVIACQYEVHRTIPAEELLQIPE